LRSFSSTAQALAARAIVRRGIRRGEVVPDTSATLLLGMLPPLAKYIRK
jgi:hypothetical protein